MTVRDKITGEEDIEPPEESSTDEHKVEYPLDEDELPEQPNRDYSGWLAILQADTPADQIHQRQAMNRAGQPVMVNGQPLTLDYVTARFVQDRLDAAVGPMNWQSVFESLPDGSVRCGIGIRAPGDPFGVFVYKYDVGVPSNIEPQKGAHSDALKRAAVQWGVARDLYDDRDEKVLNAPTTSPAQDGQQVMPRGAEPRMDAPVGQGYAQPQQQQQQQQLGAWACPIHADAKIVPAGVSKRTGNAYRAFYACPIPGCDQKGPYA